MTEIHIYGIPGNVVVPQQGSPNRGVYDFCHQDTDVEESPRMRRSSKLLVASDSISDTKRNTTVGDILSNMNERNRYRRVDSLGDAEEEYNSDELQEIIDSSILDQNWLRGMDSGSFENDTPVESMDIGSSEDHTPSPVQDDCPAVAPNPIDELVIRADEMVRSPSPSPMMSQRVSALRNPKLGSLRKNLPPLNLQGPEATEASTSAQNKNTRIRNWIASQKTMRPDSCDASGELTTGESETESSGNEGKCANRVGC